jgi:hypothetical protein
MLRKHRRRGARQVGVEQKAHGPLGRQRTMFLLIDEFAGELERGANVGNCQTIFFLDFLEGHAPGKAADDESHRHSRAADDGFAVANFWVDDDALVHAMNLSRVNETSNCVAISRFFGWTVTVIVI